jgi:integrative and conjugative element protein (TIGR02256 family)
MRAKEDFIEFVCNARNVRISPNVLNVFKKYEQYPGRRESGGILLGYAYDDYDEIVKVTTPSRMDFRSLFFFNRSKRPAQFHINKSWLKSSGTLIFLGEWHTHCEVNPKPSQIDRNMIKKVFTETIMDISYLYLIIVGLNDTYWVGLQNSNGLNKLERA